MKEIKFKYIKDSLNYLSANFIVKAVGLITLPIYTRFLTPSDFGVVVLFGVFGSVVVGLISCGLQSATYRYYFKYHDDIYSFKILNTNNIVFLFLMFCSFGILIWPMLERISSIIFNNNISTYLLKLSYLHGCMQYILNYLMFIFIAQTRSRAFSTITVAQTIISTAISLYFIYLFSLTYMARIYALMITKGILVLVTVYLTKDLFTNRFSAKLFKESMKFSYPQIPLTLISMIYSSFDKTMLNKYKGLTSVGHYNIGERFAGLIKAFMDSIDRVWSPFFLKKAQEDSIASKQAIVRRFFEMAFVFMFLGLGIIYFSEEMIKILTTKQFHVAKYIVPVYVFYYLFGIIAYLAINQITYSEKTLNLLPPSIVSVVLNVILNIFFIKLYGAIGAAFATAIAALGAAIAEFYIGNKVYPLPVKKKNVLGLYFLMIVFVIPVYPIMASDLGIILKIVLKLVIIILFIYTGFKMKLISIQYAKTFFNTFAEKVKT